MKMIAFLKPFLGVLFSILIILASIFAIKVANLEQNEDVFSLFSDYEKVTIVTKQSSNDLKVPTMKNGNLNYITYYSNQKSLLRDKKDMACEGVVFYFSSYLTIDYFQKKLGYNLSTASLIENRLVYQGYTSKYQDFIILKGKKINVQIAKTESAWVVGLPAILTGF